MVKCCKRVAGFSRTREVLDLSNVSIPVSVDTRKRQIQTSDADVSFILPEPYTVSPLS